MRRIALEVVLRDRSKFREGQAAAFALSMTVICDHCRHGYFGATAQNDIERDGRWLNGDMAGAVHFIDGKRRKCRAARLIPLYRLTKVTL